MCIGCTVHVLLLAYVLEWVRVVFWYCGSGFDDGSVGVAGYFSSPTGEAGLSGHSPGDVN